MTTRKDLLQRIGALGGLVAVGGGVALAEQATAASPLVLNRRFGRTKPPRVSVSLPQAWFATEQLTDVGDPAQLFAVANRVIPAPHRNVAGTVNIALIPQDAVLATAVAFKVTPEMAVYAQRTSVPPPGLGLASLAGGDRLGGTGLTFRSWAYTGQTFGVQLFVWTGDRATAVDVQTLDAVLQSLTFDEPI